MCDQARVFNLHRVLTEEQITTVFTCLCQGKLWISVSWLGERESVSKHNQRVLTKEGITKFFCYVCQEKVRISVF